MGAEHDLSPQLERMLRSSQVAVPKQLRILELNPKHSVVERLRERWEADNDDPMIADAAELLYGSALLAEGSELPDPARFNSLLTDLMGRGL